MDHWTTAGSKILGCARSLLIYNYWQYFCARMAKAESTHIKNKQTRRLLAAFRNVAATTLLAADYCCCVSRVKTFAYLCRRVVRNTQTVRYITIRTWYNRSATGCARWALPHETTVQCMGTTFLSLGLTTTTILLFFVELALDIHLSVCCIICGSACTMILERRSFSSRSTGGTVRKYLTRRYETTQ